MVDTVRPLADVINRLADNTTGDISAQDVRDAVLSLWVNSIPTWTDVAHTQGQFVLRNGRVYQANDAIPLGTGFAEGTVGATWAEVLNGSGLIDGVAQNRFITVDAAGTPQASAMEELTDRLRTTKQLEVPGGGAFILSNWDVSTQGAIIGFEERASGLMYLPVASRLETAGATRPFFEAFGAVATTASPSNTTEEFAPSTSQHQFQFRNASRRLVSSFVVERPAGAANATQCNMTIRLNSHSDPNPLIDYKRDHPQGDTFTLGVGQTTITLPSPGFFLEGTVLYITIESEAGDNLRLLGQTIDIDPTGVTNNQPVPYLESSGRTSTNTLLAYQSEVPTTENIQDIVGTMFTDGIHNGIAVTYNDVDGVINLNVSGVQPPLTNLATVSNFSINVAATVNVGTDLNTTRQITYTTANTVNISSLSLVVTTGDDVVLTVPSSDGTHTQNVTLSGINTSTAQTITFQIRGTTTGGETIMSNVQSVTVRAVGADEQAYYGVRPTNDFATVGTGSLTSVDVQPPGTTYTISGNWPTGHVLGILEPQDRGITSIVETAFSSETYPDRWTIVTSARTINGQLYDLNTITNNGPTGTFEFRVTHG